MNTIRLIAITLPMTLLLACGGGGGGGGASVPPLTDFGPTANSSAIEAVDDIAVVRGLLYDGLYEAGSLSSGTPEDCVDGICAIDIPSIGQFGTITAFVPEENVSHLFPLDLSFITVSFEDNSQSRPVSQISRSVTFDDVTFARGSLTGPTLVSNNTFFAFETFAGWLDDSIFGTIQISVGESGNEQYQFSSYTVGTSAGSNPNAEGSATWEGATVASMKTDRTFIRGDAEITVDFTDTTVDLEFDNWRNLNNQALSSMDPITYNDLMLTNGSFEGSGEEQVEGRFYGTDHAEVGGFFNTMDVTGAFGGRRQTEE